MFTSISGLAHAEKSVPFLLWEFSDETIVRQELIDAIKAEILKEGKYQQYLYKKMLADDFEQVSGNVMTAIDVIFKGVP